MKKNIIIISYSYPPLNVPAAQRPFAIAKYLDKTKFNIKVITCNNPMTYFGINKTFNPFLQGVEVVRINSIIGTKRTENLSKLNNKKINKSVLSYLKKNIFNLGQKLVFPDRGVLWSPRVKNYFKKNQNLLKNVDIIISLSPMISNHLIAKSLKESNNKIKWIADFSDFHFVEGWQNIHSLKAYLHKKKELSIVKQSDKINFVTKTMQNAYQQYYPFYKDKMICNYNGFDTNDLLKQPKELNCKKIKFFYAGTFYNGLRSPFPLMQLLDKAIQNNLLKETEFEIEIAGYIEEDLKKELENYQSYKNIKFLGNVPREKVLDLMFESTFLWLIVANIKSHFQTVPIKLFEYISSRRPIVNFAPALSESSNIIEENNLGFNFNTTQFNVDESYCLFKDLIDDFKRGNFNKPLLNTNLDSFTWKNQIKLYQKQIEK